MPERTLILVKPDAVRRNLIGEVISRIERKGLKVIAMDLRTIDRVTAEAKGGATPTEADLLTNVYVSY